MRCAGGEPRTALWGGCFCFCGLEIQLQSQLNDARIVSVLDLTEVACAEVVADSVVQSVALELCMVPQVEELRAKLKVAPSLFAEHEVLEQGNIPILATWPTDGVAFSVAPAVWSADANRRRVDRGVEPF